MRQHDGANELVGFALLAQRNTPTRTEIVTCLTPEKAKVQKFPRVTSIGSLAYWGDSRESEIRGIRANRPDAL